MEHMPTAFHVMTKPIGPICNLDCTYCFYLEKEELYPAESREEPSWAMPDVTLESYIQQYIEAQDVPVISFAWQGGEPTLLGVRFFEKVVALQAKYAGGTRIENAFQTNGTLLDDAWGEFLAKNKFLVGISIDGPAHLHDYYRVDKQQRPTFERVMAGIEVLKKHHVEFNTLTVVNRQNAKEPLALYNFLKEIGSGYIQFIPLVERAPLAPIETTHGLIQLSLASPPRSDTRLKSPVTEWSVRAEDYGAFLCTIFDAWVTADVGRVFVQLFDVALGNWAQMGGGMCVFSENCGAALAMEHNGDLYSCDHYVYPEYKLGNIKDISLAEMVNSPAQQQFGTDKSTTLPRYCRECSVRFACHGECPKHRFMRTPDGEWGLNYLCPAYKKFFYHIDPHMKTMTQLLYANRPPAEIMRLLAKAPTKTLGRNEPCHCGSGLKYKKCHGK
jgi:uncharacterized protein